MQIKTYGTMERFTNNIKEIIIMAKFGKKSLERLETLHPDLKIILYDAIQIYDFSILDGLRSEEKQNKTFESGHSTKQYPDSKHNKSKNEDESFNYEISDAVDIAPYPIKWPELNNQTSKEYTKRMGEFYRLAGIIQAIADKYNIKIRWGGDFKWKFDGPHFERVVD